MPCIYKYAPFTDDEEDEDEDEETEANDEEGEEPEDEEAGESDNEETEESDNEEAEKSEYVCMSGWYFGEWCKATGIHMGRSIVFDGDKDL